MVRQGVKKYMVLAVAPCRQSVGKGTLGQQGGITPKSHGETLGYSTGRMLTMYIMRGRSGYTGICELRKDYHVVEILDLGASRNLP